MKEKSYLMILFATILIASLILQFQTYASPGPTVYLDPSDYIFDADTVSIGHKFNVTIRVKDLAKLMMFQVCITFNDDYINITQFWANPDIPIEPPYVSNRTDAVRAWPSDDLGGRSWDSRYVFYNKAGGMIGNPSYYHIGPGQGAVKLGDTLFAAATLNASKTYKLASIELTITAMPPEGEKLSCTLGINNIDTYLYDASGQVPGTAKMDGHYEISSKIPSHNLTIQVNNPSWGSTAPSGTISMLEGESRDIQANPYSGYVLDHWELDGVNEGSANPYRVTMGTKDMTLLAVFAVAPPPTGARLFIDPPKIIDPNMVPSSTFAINITIDDVANLRICEFNLTYDTNVLSWVGIEIFKVQGKTPSAIGMFDDEVGYMWVKLTYSSSITTDSPIALVRIKFHVDAIGATPLDLTNTTLTNSEGQPIPHTAIDGFFASLIQDLAITSVVPSRNSVYRGQLVTINVTAKNLGNQPESFDVKAYYDTGLIGTQHVTNLTPNTEVKLTFTWNTSLAEPFRNYTIKAEAAILPYEQNTADNTYIDGTVQILIQDLAITSVVPSRSWVYQGWQLDINATAKNLGSNSQTFNVAVYYDNSLIGTKQVVDLAPNAEITLIFVWNTSLVAPCHNYTITGKIAILPWEFNVTNNIYTDGFVKVRFLGDVNGDGKVDMMDIYIVTKAFGSDPGHPRWNPDADMDQNNLIDMRDTWLTAKNFGKVCNP
jgi:hypothetical protein